MALKLAVVDDEEPILKALRRLFSRDYEFHAFSQPEAFLAALPTLAPAIVLTDLAMPGMSGLALTEKVMEAEKMTQVVMMTGAIEPARVVEAYRAGVSDFLLKPWDDAGLREAIDAAARRYVRWFRLAYPGQREPR
jgi:two-component system response regulator FixJ